MHARCSRVAPRHAAGDAAARAARLRGPARVDVVAQTLRIGCLLRRAPAAAAADRSTLARLRAVCSRAQVRPSGARRRSRARAEPRSGTSGPTMFADQALAFARRRADDRATPTGGERSAARLTARTVGAGSRPCGERAGGSGCASRRCTWRWRSADRLAALAPARARRHGRRHGARHHRLVPGARRARDARRKRSRRCATRSRACDEPAQVIVVANGAPLATYDDAARAISRRRMGARRRAARLRRRDRARPRARAPRRHVPPQQRHDARRRRARGAAAAARRRTCSRSASQILQQDATGRREETGFTDWYVDASGVHLYHAPLPDADGAVPHLCASGGAALFRTAPLRALRARTAAATTRSTGRTSSGACARGATACRVLFCPRSLARHRASRDDRPLLRAPTSSTASSSATGCCSTRGTASRTSAATG